jgi:hypothetical protein
MRIFSIRTLIETLLIMTALKVGVVRAPALTPNDKLSSNFYFFSKNELFRLNTVSEMNATNKYDKKVFSK